MLDFFWNHGSSLEDFPDVLGIKLVVSIGISGQEVIGDVFEALLKVVFPLVLNSYASLWLFKT